MSCHNQWPARHVSPYLTIPSQEQLSN